MRNYVDALAPRFLLDVLAQLGCALFDGGRGRDGRENHFSTICRKGFGDSAPVMNSWEELSYKA